MKTMIFKSFLALFFGSMLVFSACAKKSNTSSNRAGNLTRGNGVVNNNATTLNVSRCTDGSSGWGRIVDDGTLYGTLFREAYYNFLSSASNPEYLGNLDGSSSSTTTGVNMELKLKIVNNQQLDLSQTRFTMEINDSKVGEIGSDGQPMTEIKVNFSSAKAGEITNFNGNSGSFQLTFADDYGTVSVNGTFNGTEARGNVSFNNTKSYDGNTPKSGKLGAFYMKSCGLFN